MAIPSVSFAAQPRFQSSFRIYNWPSPAAEVQAGRNMGNAYIHPQRTGDGFRIENRYDSALTGALENAGLSKGIHFDVLPY